MIPWGVLYEGAYVHTVGQFNALDKLLGLPDPFPRAAVESTAVAAEAVPAWGPPCNQPATQSQPQPHTHSHDHDLTWFRESVNTRGEKGFRVKPIVFSGKGPIRKSQTNTAHAYIVD